jgi:hypothetical protein
MFMPSNWLVFMIVVGRVLALDGHGLDRVDLEWRPDTPEVLIGRQLDMRLYAVSDGDADQLTSVVTAILVWDPTCVKLQEHYNNGPYEWGSSEFPAYCELNDTWDDGDAFYAAHMPLPGVPAAVPPEGLLVTTMRFVTTLETCSTELYFLPEYEQAPGVFCYTRVLSGKVPSLDVTGNLGSATATVLPCGSLADVDLDCDVDLEDLAAVVACITGPDGGPPDSKCQAADLDRDGDVDLDDVGAVQAEFTGQ